MAHSALQNTRGPHQTAHKIIRDPAELLQRCGKGGRRAVTSTGLIEVDVHPLQLQVGVTLIGARERDAVLVGDDLLHEQAPRSSPYPELGTDLVLTRQKKKTNQPDAARTQNLAPI